MARVIIEKDRIYADNWNRSNRHGKIDPNSFNPEPKNPILAKFFMNIGRAEWAGSGVRNLYEYTKIYSGGFPSLIEDDLFETIVPMQEEPSVHDGVHDGVHDKKTNLLKFCTTPKSLDEMQKHIGITSRAYFRNNLLKPLIDKQLLKMTIPEKPRSHYQKYLTVEDMSDV